MDQTECKYPLELDMYEHLKLDGETEKQKQKRGNDTKYKLIGLVYHNKVGSLKAEEAQYEAYVYKHVGKKINEKKEEKKEDKMKVNKDLKKNE